MRDKNECTIEAAGKVKYIELADKMIKYYNANILSSQKSKYALNSYKNTGYRNINRMLMKHYVQNIDLDEVVDAIRKVKTRNERDAATQTVYELFKTDVYPAMHETLETIKVLDKLINNAPPISDKPFVVYRGMDADIYHDLQCENGKYYYTFPSYLSSSFSQQVARSFRSNTGVLYTIELPKDTHGLYLLFDHDTTHFEDSEVDPEFEYVLQRGSKFEVVSIDYIPDDSVHSIKYKTLPCMRKNPYMIKHYKLRLVEQPSLSSLKKEYKTMLQSATINMRTGRMHNINGRDMMTMLKDERRASKNALPVTSQKPSISTRSSKKNAE